MPTTGKCRARRRSPLPQRMRSTLGAPDFNRTVTLPLIAFRLKIAWSKMAGNDAGSRDPDISQCDDHNLRHITILPELRADGPSGLEPAENFLRRPLGQDEPGAG
jgi:hypothetical protein